MTTNPIAHVEIPVADLPRACRFYERVFGTPLVVAEIDGNTMALFPHAEGAPGASLALACGPSYAPGTAGARVYVAVADIEATLARAVAEGAELHYPLTEVPGYGWVAEFLDCEGNVIALHADLARSRQENAAVMPAPARRQIIQPVDASQRAELLELAVRTGLFSPAEADALLGGVLDQLADGALPRGHAALACRDHQLDRLTGWTYVAPDPYAEAVWTIWWLGVLPEAQGTGVGSALLRAAESLAQAAGARIVVVETSSSDVLARARRFYAAQGYAACGHVPHFYGEGDHKVIFSRRPRAADPDATVDQPPSGGHGPAAAPL